MTTSQQDQYFDKTGYYSQYKWINGRRIFRPDFPSNCYKLLQRSSIATGDRRREYWDTTYGTEMRPRTAEHQQQKIDTITLQKTHWTNGNIETTKESEYVDKYRPFSVTAARSPEFTRDKMMKTSFAIGDKNQPFEVRDRSIPVMEPVERPNYREMNTATHFNLTTPTAPSWETTSRDAYKPHDVKPAESAQMELNKGLGAKSNFDQYGAFQTRNSEASDAYIDHKAGMPEYASTQSVVVDRAANTINFNQSTSNKWQRNNVRLSGQPNEWLTTSQCGCFKGPITPIDCQQARIRRAQFTRSCVDQGTPAIPTVTKSVMHTDIVPHPDCRPPPPAPATAFISNHEFRNWDGPISTTYKDSFQPKKAEIPTPANKGLQRTNAKFGYDGINEKTTLYQESFRKPPPTHDPVDAAAMRAFHTAHHTKNDLKDASDTGKTTYQVDYVGHPGFRPPDLANVIKGSNNVVPNEERFNIKESTMKASYKKPPPFDQAQVRDNKLQRSHLQLKSQQDPWTTTQQDYFLFEKYNPPAKCIDYFAGC